MMWKLVNNLVICAGKVFLFLHKFLRMKIPNSVFNRNDPGFAGSEEAEIAEDLLKAYDTRDQELLEKTVRLQHVTFLDNEVAKLARLLTVPGEVLSSASPKRDNNRQQQQYQKMPSADNSDVRNMSHAQARAELYSRPTQPVDDLSGGFSKMKVQPERDDEDDEGLR
jgi:hypothetical protein